MPLWLVFAILQPATLTVVNFTDKYILARRVKDYRGFVLFSSSVALIVGTLIWSFAGFPLLSLRDSALSILVGSLIFSGSIIYAKVLSEHEASKVIFLFQLQPLVVLLLSVLFIGENFNLKNGVGFALVLFSTLAASIDKEPTKVRSLKPVVLIFSADVIWAIASVLFKFLTEANNFPTLISYESWGWALGGAILFALFPSVRQAFLGYFKTFRPSTLAVIFGNELTYVVSKLFGFLAISLGSVTFVNVINGTGVLFGVLYGWVLTLVAPQIFNEETSKKGLAIKFALGAVVLFGIYLIAA